jgi:hypothetical protein
MLTTDEYERQKRRVEAAITLLRSGGSRFQAIGRAYFLVHLMASYAAAKHGVTVKHEKHGRKVELDHFTHNVMPDVVKALYSGNASGRVTPGSTPGIGAGNLTERQAMRYAELLQRDRKDVDYGPTDELEPYTEHQTDERLRWAAMIADDLRKIV